MPLSFCGREACKTGRHELGLMGGWGKTERGSRQTWPSNLVGGFFGFCLLWSEPCLYQVDKRAKMVMFLMWAVRVHCQKRLKSRWVLFLQDRNKITVSSEVQHWSTFVFFFFFPSVPLTLYLLFYVHKTVIFLFHLLILQPLYPLDLKWFSL